MTPHYAILSGMAIYKYKSQKDEAWLAGKVWSFPSGLHPDSEDELTRRKSRKPLGPELEEKRRQHMIEMHAEGVSYALIAKLYRLDRSLVRKIIIQK